MGLRSLFCFFSTSKSKSTNRTSPGNDFPWKDCKKWQTMTEGYEAEGYTGAVKCAGCKAEIKAYRQITGKDVLRFEQEIEGGKGRCTLSLPIAFNGEAAKWRTGKDTKVGKSGGGVKGGEKGGVGGDEKVLGRYKSSFNGESYDVLKEVFFASVKCVNCGEIMHMYDRIIRYDGKDETNWVLSRKDPKVIDEDIFSPGCGHGWKV